MNEVEKMYENCNIKPKQEGYCGWDSNCPYPHHKCNDECPYWKYKDIAEYPPFTAEKQIELIKWLCINTYRNYLLFRYNFTNNYWQVECNMIDSNKELVFSNALASIINNLWQDLTKDEQEQIREILK